MCVCVFFLRKRQSKSFLFLFKIDLPMKSRKVSILCNGFMCMHVFMCVCIYVCVIIHRPQSWIKFHLIIQLKYLNWFIMSDWYKILWIKIENKNTYMKKMETQEYQFKIQMLIHIRCITFTQFSKQMQSETTTKKKHVDSID